MYIVLLTVFAPISFMQIQVRIADSLTILAVFFGWPAIIGMTIGHMIINYTFSPIIPILDLMTPIVASLPGILIMYKWRHNKTAVLIGSLIHNILVGAWVAMMLALAFGLPFFLNWLLVSVGETIAVTVIGYPLYLEVKRRGLFSLAGD